MLGLDTEGGIAEVHPRRLVVVLISVPAVVPVVVVPSTELDCTALHCMRGANAENGEDRRRDVDVADLFQFVPTDVGPAAKKIALISRRRGS